MRAVRAVHLYGFSRFGPPNQPIYRAAQHWDLQKVWIDQPNCHLSTVEPPIVISAL